MTFRVTRSSRGQQGMLIMDEFMLRALLAGAGVALIAGPMGSFVVWRRMAYFGAALSHSALLGVVLALLFNIHIYLGILFVSFAVSLALVALRRQHQLTSDTLLGILAHAALALGLVALALMGSVRLDIVAYLFGDLLSVRWRDIYWIFFGVVTVGLILGLIWRPLLSLTVHEELAQVEGVPVRRTDLGFMLLLSVVIAAAMQIVGLLLIVSMLILPAATGRRFASTPEQMAILASVFGVLAIGAGLILSLRLDTPAGPSVVVAATGVFLLSLLVPARS